MIMIVVVMIVRLRVSFRLEPILHVETFRFRIVKTRIEQRIWFDGTIDSDDLRRGGVQVPEPFLQSAQDIGVDEVRLCN